MRAFPLALALTVGFSGLRAAEPAVRLPPATADRPLEFVLWVGGPSLEEWERYKLEPHDRFWGSFIRAARTRLQELKARVGPNPIVRFTLLVYLKGYRRRSAQVGRDLVALVMSVRDAYRVNLVPFASGPEAVAYLNGAGAGGRPKIGLLEYFGHSNRACFMFDYSNEIASGSKAWLHESELGSLRRGAFARDAFARSWGCYGGEGFAARFHEATGIRMMGAVGKTDFSHRDEARNGIVPVLSSPGGRWVYQ